MSDKIQVLFVDDETEFVSYMKRRLELHDLEVDAYTNPVEALRETQGRSYDVGLLDLKMPEMNGEELLNHLKTRDPGMEIIILTGHGSIESAFRSGKEGAYEYLLKPCDFDELVASINTAYAKRIKALSKGSAARVDEVMRNAGSLPPLAVLKELKKIFDSIGSHLSAAAMAEGGDPESAREMMGDKDEE